MVKRTDIVTKERINIKSRLHIGVRKPIESFITFIVFILTYFLSLSFGNVAYAQNQGRSQIDSLLSEITKAKDDTVKVDLLNNLSLEYFNVNRNEEGLNYAGQAQTLAEKLNYRYGIATAIYYIGHTYYESHKYYEALEKNLVALKIFEAIGNKKDIADINSTIASIYFKVNNFNEALKKIGIALNLYEQLGDKRGIINSYTVIGNVSFFHEKNYSKTLNIFFDQLRIARELGDSVLVADAFSGIASCYVAQQNYAEGVKTFLIQAKIFEELGDDANSAFAYSQLGVGYLEYMKNYPEALNVFFKSLNLAEKLNDKDQMLRGYLNIGSTYIKQGKSSEAKQWFQKALVLSKENQYADNLQKAYSGLSKSDSALGNYKAAFENYKLAVQYKDSVFNRENAQKLAQIELQNEFQKKETATKAEQEKKDIRQRNIRQSITAGLVLALIFLIVVYFQRNKISKARKRSDELLLNILPGEVAEELKTKGSAEAKHFAEVTVMFTDFKGFTRISEKLSPSELVSEIDNCFKAFDNIVTKHNIEKIKTIGDAYMCAGGLPVANTTNATDVVKAAMEIQQYMQQHLLQRKNEGKEIFEIRIGIHTGPVVAGIVGLKKFAYDIWGDTVNIASRMESSGEVGKVNISGTTYELVKGEFKFEYRGKVQAKNKGEIDMYYVENVFDESSIPPPGRLLIGNPAK